MTPLYIFDLDGTLALTEHRQHILDNKDDPDRWKKFFAACVDDLPNAPVIATLEMLAESGAEVWVWSGRSDEVKSETYAWLSRYVRHNILSSLWMRKEGDFTPDEELKEGWLKGLDPAYRARLIAVFDDRNKVVAMWRRNGVACFQVAPGEF